MWPPVSTNERPGYNEHIRHCFRYEHSFKERFVKYPRQQRNTCANQIHRDNLNKYSNGFLFENTDLIRLSQYHTCWEITILMLTQDIVWWQYLWTGLRSPLIRCGVTQCHAESRGVTNVTWVLSWMLSSDTLTRDTHETWRHVKMTCYSVWWLPQNLVPHN